MSQEHSVKFGGWMQPMRLFDRQLVVVTTGNEAADMLIADLSARLNKQADEAQSMWNEIQRLSARPEALQLTYDQREDIIARLQRVRITDWQADGTGYPQEIREVTAADMLDVVLDYLKTIPSFPLARSEEGKRPKFNEFGMAHTPDPE